MENKVNKTTKNPRKFNRKLMLSIAFVALIVAVAMAISEYSNL